MQNRSKSLSLFGESRDSDTKAAWKSALDINGAPMFVTNLQSAKEWFEVLQTGGQSQAAVMDLVPGQASGDDAESHPHSDQVLLVVEGEVLAVVAEDRARLHSGDVVIVPAGVQHRFLNESDAPARTFSVYAPPAYPNRRR